MYFGVCTLCTSKYMSTARRDERRREKRDETRQEEQTVPREIMTVNVCITVGPSSGITIVSTHKTVGRIHARLTAHARPLIHTNVNCS